MKKVILLALSLLTFDALATPIPTSQLQSYRDAVKFSLAQNPLNCTWNPSNYNWISGSLAKALEYTDSADLSSDGQQPLLTFVYHGASLKAVYKVTTSSDYKSVLSVTMEQTTCGVQSVNVGDLRKPVIVQQEVCSPQASVVCN